MPSHTSTSTALSRSGLLSVMVATGALISTSTLLVMLYLLGLCSPSPSQPSPPRSRRAPQLERRPSPPPGARISAIPLPQGRGQGEGRSRTLPVEGLHQRRQARAAHAGLIGLIERDAVEQARVALHHLVAELVVGRGDRIGVEHFVGDEIGHGLPVALHALPVELSGEAAPAVHVEHGLIRAGGGVKGDLL